MRRIAPLLAFALLGAPMLSGCLTAQATAMQYDDTAESRARQWNPNAELAGIVGIEGQSSAWMGGYTPSQSSGSSQYRSAQQADYWARAAEDGNVGDGRCEIWVYLYVADGEAEAYAVVVDKDGEIVDAGPTDREADQRPVGEWRVDSDRALQIAKAANQGLREGLDSENFGVVQKLENTDEYRNATWMVAGGGGDASGGGGGLVEIDAVTGQVLESHGGFRSR